ncbi:MAG: putative quinol monooxygenase [Blastocatellia bacterium]
MFIVTVVYEVPAEHVAVFREAILRNAAASVENEETCRQFDVSFSENGQRCFLYEKYDNAEAFAAHRQTAHFHTFFTAVSPLVSGKTLETFALADNPYLTQV